MSDLQNQNVDLPICGKCSFEYGWCKIKFIDKLIDKCPCKECLVKSMCLKMCRDRKLIYLSLPKWLKSYLYEIQHYHLYKGDREYNKLTKDLEIIIQKNLEGF